MLPAYVLGALEPDEMLAVDDYLQAHPELMAQVHALDAAAAQMAYMAPPVPLPLATEAKVLARAQATWPQRVGARNIARPPMATPPLRTPARAARSGGFGQWLGRWWRSRGIFDLALAGSAMAVLLLSIALAQTVTRLDRVNQELASLEQQVVALQSDNTSLRDQNIEMQQELQNRQNQLATLTGATQIIALAGTEAAPDASATLYVSDNESLLILRDVSELAEAQTYQLWLIPPGGDPLPAGILGQATGGTSTSAIQFTTPLDDYAAVAVSVEPEGGSTTPTGPVVLVGDIL